MTTSCGKSNVRSRDLIRPKGHVISLQKRTNKYILANKHPTLYNYVVVIFLCLRVIIVIQDKRRVRWSDGQSGQQ